MLRIEHLSKRYGNVLALGPDNFQISINPYDFFVKT
jgi:hypothetical protein